MILKEIAEQSKKWNRLTKKEKYSEALGFFNHCRANIRSKEYKSELARYASEQRWKNVRKLLNNSALNGDISK